jgi:hypothetical protein
MRSAALLAVLVLASCTAAVPDDPVACSWSWTDLPLPPDRMWTSVTVSDGRGTYAGLTSSLEPGGPDEVVLWQDGSPTVLGAPFERSAQVLAVNRNGVVLAEVNTVPVRFRDGEWERLADPDGGHGRADAIDADGTVVGTAFRPSPDGSRLVRWADDRADVLEEVDFPFRGGMVTGLGDDGTLLAKSDADGLVHGYLLRPGGKWVRVEYPDDTADVVPVATSGGVVIGRAQSLDNRTALVEWDLSGRVLRARPDTTPVDVNSSGQVLGFVRPMSSPDPGGEVLLWRGDAREGVFPVPGSRSEGMVDPVAVDDDGTMIGHRTVTGVSTVSVVGRCA